MTTRSEFFEERFGTLKDGIYQNKYSLLQMREYSKKFKTRIFRGYLDFFNIQIIENSLSNITFKKLTSDLLFMRFFSEVNSDKKNLYLYDVYVYDVFEHYTENKCKKYSDGITQDNVSLLFNEIISCMINDNNYVGISTEHFSQEKIRLLNEMIDNEVIFKNETRVKSGYLYKSVEIVGFTFDEYRDYCITNYLLEHYDTEEKLLGFWKRMTDEQLTICEGVQKYLFFLSHTKYRESLYSIISQVPEYDELYWKYIWNIEDKYITDYDVDKWKKQIIENDDKMLTVIRTMILRYDCNYYTKINIKVLMHILDELSESSEELFDSIVWLFPYKYEDEYDYDRRNPIFYLNGIIQSLSKIIKNEVPLSNYEEFLKFTVYITGNAPYEICCLWDLFYQHNPKHTYKILEEMNLHKSQLIQSNSFEIISHLLDAHQDLKIQQLREDNDCSENKSINIDEFLKSLLNDLEE